MRESNNFKLLLTIDFEEQRRLEKAGFPKEAIDESLKGTYRIIIYLVLTILKAYIVTYTVEIKQF